MPLVSAQGVSIEKASLQILRDISLTIHSGEIVTVIGPNGAGKSTLIKALLKLIKPSSGTITYQPNLTIGYMPQKLSLDPTLPLSVKRFLQLGAGKKASPERAKILLAEVGAEQVYERMVGRFQGENFNGYCWQEH